MHDLGLKVDRETHHHISGSIIRKDTNLRKWFSEDEIELIAQAAEDHRASNTEEPRTIYGKIISEADRVIDCYRTLERTLSFGISNYPNKPKEEQVEIALKYITEKYGPNGRIKIYLPESPSSKELQKLQQLISNKERFRNELNKIYDKLANK